MAVLDNLQVVGELPADPRLGRLAHFDPRTTEFQIRTMLGVAPVVLRDTAWACNFWLDQGQIGQCVGFGCAHELGSEPVVVPVDYDIGHSIYVDAQIGDPWPETPPFEGTSVLAGLQVLQKRGYISQYRAAGAGSGTPLKDIVEGIVSMGPGLFGINWYQGMMSPDSSGFIHPSGTLAGGHCILAVGVHFEWPVGVNQTFETLDLEHSYITLHNSWSKGWGLNGECSISLADVSTLMSQAGEFWIPLGRLDPSAPLPPAPPTPPPPPDPVVYNFFSINKSNVFHKMSHKIRGSREYLYITAASAIATNKRSCRTCKPT